MSIPVPKPAPVNLSESDAAARLATTVRSLQRLRKHGKAPPHARVGGRVVYPIAALDAWLAARLEPAREAP
jgi:hypothetical protein